MTILRNSGWLKLGLVGMLGFAWVGVWMPLLQGQQNRFDTEISGRTQEKVSLHLTGFSGEVREVLEFDLYLGGFQLVEAGKGRYELSGNTESDVRGTLKDSQGHVLFDRIYPGGTRRTQAHTLANDVIQLGTGSAPSFTNQKIIYRMDGNIRNQWNELVSEIYASDYDGANPVQLTHDGSIVRSPAWKPSERTIYYTSFLNGAPHVYSHDLTTGARRPYAAFGGLNDGTAFSWDGQRVAMILSRAGSPDLWVASAAGTNWKRLTQAREEESSPCWSPDGRQICFSSARDGGIRLYTISPEGGEAKPLNTGGIRGTTEPDWSPDGRWIAFTRMGRGQNFQIYVVPSEGGNPKKVADGEDPSWGPNSRLLLFVRRTKDGNRRLSLLDVPTGHVKYSLPVQGSCSQPSWAR